LSHRYEYNAIDVLKKFKSLHIYPSYSSKQYQAFESDLINKSRDH